MMATNNSAQMSALMDLELTMMNNASGRAKAVLGVVFRAARKATGTASTRASAVPSVAMFKVSQSGRSRTSA